MPQLADPNDYGNTPGNGPLRQGGQQRTDPNRPDKDLPSTPSKAAQSQAFALGIVRDLFAGQERVHAKSVQYLPQEPAEDGLNYQSRLARSVFTNFFRRTVEGLTGFVFRKDPVLGEDVPAPIQDHWENIDNAGTHGDVFCAELFQDSLTAGHAAILVDFPKTDGQQTAEDEQFVALPVRPYWVPIQKDNILSWRTSVENGHQVLTQLVIRECTMVPDGDFGEKEQTRYRVFYRGPTVNEKGEPIGGTTVGYRLLEVTKDNSVIEVDAGTYPTQTVIPVAEVRTSGRRGLFDSDPPLIDLAFLNIAHYQQWSDYANSIHKTNVPSLVIQGIEDDETGSITVGNAAITFKNPQGNAKWISHDGAALGSSKAALDDLKADMATFGVSMLSSQKRVAETAEAKRIDKSAADSALGKTVRGLQDGVEQALGFHARYLKGQPDGGSITINRDFDAMLMEPEVMLAYLQWVKEAGLPWEIALEKLQAGGRISDAVDIEAIAMEMIAAEAAQREQERQQAEEQARMQQQGQQNQPPVAA